MVLVNFWRYPDPYQRFLIRIRIRPNDTDPTGSGSETLVALEFFFSREVSKSFKCYVLVKNFDRNPAISLKTQDRIFQHATLTKSRLWLAADTP